MTASRPAPRPRGRPLRHPPGTAPGAGQPQAGQARPAQKAQAKPRRRRFGGALILFLLLLIGVILFWLVAGVFGAMLKLATITVEWPAGESAIVSDDDVMAAAGLRAGDRLYTIDSGAIETAVMRANPYLESVVVERRLPDTVALICTPRQADYYIEVNDEWFAISPSLVVLEQSDRAETFAQRGMVHLILPEVRSALVGRALVFAGDFDPAYLCALLEDHRASGLYGETNLVRVESRFDVRMIVRDKYALTLGESDDAALKLELAEKILADSTFSANTGAFVDLSNPKESSAILDKQTDYTVLWRN